MKILFTGDWHLRGNNPRNRTDDYKEAAKEKLREVFKIAADNEVTAILQPGDIFHSPEVSIQTLLEFKALLDKCPVPIYATVGNHDVFGYNLETYGRTSLQLLELLVPQLSVEGGWRSAEMYAKEEFNYQPYTSNVEVYGYTQSWFDEEAVKILVIHSMLLDHNLPYEARFTNLYEVETNADIILSGHDHVGYGVIKRQDGKVFCNPGALMRISASEAEMTRPIQVALIDTDKMDIELIPLKCARPGNEVLDRTRIEENVDRQYAMEEFTGLVQSGTGVARMNIPEIIEKIGKQENIPAEVVSKAIELLKGEEK